MSKDYNPKKNGVVNPDGDDNFMRLSINSSRSSKAFNDMAFEDSGKQPLINR